MPFCHFSAHLSSPLLVVGFSTCRVLLKALLCLSSVCFVCLSKHEIKDYYQTIAPPHRRLNNYLITLHLCILPGPLQINNIVSWISFCVCAISPAGTSISTGSTSSLQRSSCDLMPSLTNGDWAGCTIVQRRNSEDKLGKKPEVSSWCLKVILQFLTFFFRNLSNFMVFLTN